MTKEEVKNLDINCMYSKPCMFCGARIIRIHGKETDEKWRKINFCSLKCEEHHHNERVEVAKGTFWKNLNVY